jgi:hypothetical protein
MGFSDVGEDHNRLRAELDRLDAAQPLPRPRQRNTAHTIFGGPRGESADESSRWSMITAYGDDEHMRTAQDHGAAAFFANPVGLTS